MRETLLVLFSAHFIADFLLQPDWLQQKKDRPWAGLLHSFMVGGLSCLFLQQGAAWGIFILLFISHFAIDAIKHRCPDTWQIFCLDQFAHLASTVLILSFCRSFGQVSSFEGLGLKWMVLVAGFAVTVQGAGFLVGKVADRLQEENNLSGTLKGLKNGGKLIGQLERAVIFLLILLGQPTGIGFLIAAKSILRFGEAKDDQKLAEYVLIGTLLSFGLAIATAALTKSIMGMI